MTAILAALWTFANSPLGMGLIVGVVGKLFHKTVKDSNRQAQILGYADTAFLLVEALAPALGLKGKEKYLKFVEQVVNSLKAAGQAPLSAQEMAVLTNLAEAKAWISKTPAASAR
jgi:hypothetical protein